MALTPLVLSAKIEATGAKEAEAQLAKVGATAEKSSGLFGGGGIKSLVTSMLGIAGGIGIVTAVKGAFDLVTGSLGDLVSEAANSEAVMAQVNAGLKSTHGVSGQTAQSIQDLAGQIQSMSGIDDEAVESAEAMLLTFTNIGGKTFPQATTAVADLATAMNKGAIPNAQQMQDASIKLGKALNDPIHNLDALSKSGIQFTDQQKAQIIAMQKAGDIAGAQQIILGELNKEVGGRAAAAGKTFTGAWAIMQGELGNVREAIGTPLINAFTGILQVLNPVITAVGNFLPGAFDAMGKALAPLGDALGNLWNVFRNGINPALSAVGEAFKNAKGPGDAFGGIIAQLSRGLGLIAPIAYQLGQNLGGLLLSAAQNIGPLFSNLAGVAQQMAPTLLNLAGQVFPLLGQVVTQLGGTLGGIVMNAIQNAGPLFRNLGGIIMTLAPILLDLASHALPLVAQIMRFVGNVGTTVLLPLLGTLAGIVRAVVVPVIGMLGQFLGKVFDVLGTTVLPALQQAATAIQTQLLPPLQNIIQRVLPVLNGLFQFLGWLLGTVIGPIIGAVLGPVLSLLITILGKVFTAVGWLLDRLGELKDHIAQALQPVIKNLSEKLGELHSWFNDKILPVIQKVQQFFRDHILPVLQQVGGFIRDQVVAHLQTLWSIIQTKVLPILGDLAGKVKDSIGREFQIFGDVIHTITGKVGDFLGNLGHIKDFFANLHLEFPKIKLPHFSIDGSFNLNPPSVPHLDVQWYAKGGVFMEPQIAGVGDVPEAVIPLDKLPNMLAAGLSAAGGAGGSGAPIEIPVTLTLDGRVLAQVVVKHQPGAIRAATGNRGF